MILPPTSEISHHHKVTNITMSSTSLSPFLAEDIRSWREIYGDQLKIYGYLGKIYGPELKFYSPNLGLPSFRKNIDLRYTVFWHKIYGPLWQVTAYRHLIYISPWCVISCLTHIYSVPFTQNTTHPHLIYIFYTSRTYVLCSFIPAYYARQWNFYFLKLLENGENNGHFGGFGRK